MSSNPPDKTHKQKNTQQQSLRRWFTNTHIFLYRTTGGIIGGRAPGYPFLLLMTKGRLSGKERTTPLFYFTDTGRFIIIASNWGGSNDPLWWRNLQADPHCLIQVGRKVIAITATEAEGEERERLWDIVTKAQQRFIDYQKGTTRRIPVIILTPDA